MQIPWNKFLCEFQGTLYYTRCDPYKVASYCALDSVDNINTWVLTTEPGSVLATTTSG